MAKEQRVAAEGVLNNDIVGGNRTPGDTAQNNNWVRVFSEGIPAAATEADIRRIRTWAAKMIHPPANCALHPFRGRKL